MKMNKISLFVFTIICSSFLEIEDVWGAGCNFPSSWVADDDTYWYFYMGDSDQDFFWVLEYTSQMLQRTPVINGDIILSLRHKVVMDCILFVGEEGDEVVLYVYEAEYDVHDLSDNGNYHCVGEQMMEYGAGIIRKTVRSDTVWDEVSCKAAQKDDDMSTTTITYHPKFNIETRNIDMAAIACPMTETTYDVAYYVTSSDTPECDPDTPLVGHVSGSTLYVSRCNPESPKVYTCVSSKDYASGYGSAIILVESYPINLRDPDSKVYCAHKKQTQTTLYLTTANTFDREDPITCDMSRDYTDSLDGTHTVYSFMDNQWIPDNAVYVSFSFEENFDSVIGANVEAFKNAILSQLYTAANIYARFTDRLNALAVIANDDGTTKVEFVIVSPRGPGESSSAYHEGELSGVVSTCPFNLTGPSGEVLTVRCDTYFSYTIPSGGACESNPCQNGGDCSLVTSGTFVCNCAMGWEGMYCETEGHNACDPDPCMNGAECGDAGDGTPMCTCAPGWEGNTCETASAGDACDPDPCQNSGVCDGGLCTCGNGFLGVVCQYVDGCSNNPCANGGDCINSEAGNGGYTCSCTSQWMGSTCGTEDPCINDPCENGGTCNAATDGSYACACPADYLGTTCNMDVSETSGGLVGDNMDYQVLIVAIVVVAAIIMLLIIVVVIYSWLSPVKTKKRLQWVGFPTITSTMNTRQYSNMRNSMNSVNSGRGYKGHI